MAASKQAYDVKDFTEPVKEISKLVKETYLNTLDFSLSVAEENKKVLNKQLDYVIEAEKDYVSSVKEFYGSLPKQNYPFAKVDSGAFDDGLAKVFEFQKNLADSFKGISGNAAAESYDFAKKNVIKAFTMFDEALDSFKL
ncbi:MAG: hypothetical protein A3J42_00950 [Candidatus Dadabacteria bacterium RIFCSPHIGHO2_12_FULL_53_21]|nr:MAG: hypothetical protein A3J42_00950 [Candidatus Dadabacteria bacterium RIFCSPHIGHO2_12_FULL_53_21]